MKRTTTTKKRKHTGTRSKPVHGKRFCYTAVYEPAPEGGYVVSVPALPGLVTEGDTLQEARAMVRDTIRGYLESLYKLGEEIPIEHGDAITEPVRVTLSRA